MIEKETKQHEQERKTMMIEDVTVKLKGAGDFAGKTYALTPVKHGDLLTPTSFYVIEGSAFPADPNNGVLIGGCWAKEVV